MALTHVIAIRNSMADVPCDALDAGAADATGDLVYMTALDAEVSIAALANPAFGAPASGVKTANTITDDPSSAGGTAALFKLQDRDNGEVLRGSVTAIGGGGDIELTSVVIAANEPINTSSLTYTAAA